MAGSPIRGSAAPADNDVYTALMLVSFLFTLTATIYIAYRAISLFGSLFPPPGG